ncbi:MAG: PKD domain-containing protein [Gemmatimonadales bacterium]
MEPVRALLFTPSRPLVLLLALSACNGGEALILPGDGEPAAIAIVGGDGQSGRVGEPLTDPLVVQVTDSRSRPVEGASVAFEFSGGSGAEIVPRNTTTNSDGLADAQVVLGTSFGAQTGQARVVTEEAARPIVASFSATALSEGANTMVAVSGQDQTGHVGMPLDERLVVEVTDAFGNPVAGVPIQWTAEGGGSVSEAAIETGADGRARVDRILGPTVGQQTTLASSEGLAGSPVTFVHTALPGDAFRLIIVSGNDQTAAGGSTLPDELVVRLVDAEGNGIPQTAVSWVVATGGGSAAPENSATDTDGSASSRWTLGDGLGGQRLDAVVSGVGFVSFSATATAGAPASLFIATQPPSTARNGLRFDRQPVIQVRDARGNDVAVAGVQVTVAIGSGGGELTGTRTRSTDARGRATFNDLAIIGGPGSRTLVFSASGYAGVTSSGIDLTPIPTATTITGDSPDPSVSGSTFTVAFEVTSQGPTPTGSVTVTVSGGTPRCTATLSNGSGSCPLTLNLVGDRTLTATYSGGPGFLGSSDTEPHVVNPQAPSNEPPEADFNWHCEDLTCHFTDASEDDDGSIVSRSWNFGDGTPPSSELNPSHTYAAPGIYTVTLTVTDNGGLTDVSDDDVDPKAPPPQVLALREQPSGSAIVGVPFERQPEVELRAGDDDVERAGVVITASIASGAGTLGGTATATTDEDGRAEFTNLSIEGATGPHTLRFSADGFASVTSNTVNVEKVDSDIEITSDDPDPSEAGSTFTVAFRVTSEGRTPTGSVTVTVSGGSPTCSAGLSGGMGSCQLTLNITGNRTLTATYSGDDLSGGSQDEEEHTVVAPAPASTTTEITGHSPDPSEPGTEITVSFSVTSPSGTPTGDVLVTDEIGGSCSASVAAGSCSFIPEGEGTRTITASYPGNSSFGPSSATVDHTVLPANQPPTADFSWSCDDDLNCSFRDESSDPDGILVSWFWEFGDGHTSTAQETSHTYEDEDDYDVTLTVTDDGGETDDLTQEVEVEG